MVGMTEKQMRLACHLLQSVPSVPHIMTLVCRWQVVKFVLAVSNVIRALFARLQQRNTHLNSISLLDCLLAAHAAGSTSSESLAAAVGNAPAPDTQCILQVCSVTAKQKSFSTLSSLLANDVIGLKLATGMCPDCWMRGC